MKKLLLICILCYGAQNCCAQAYIPMPSDSAVWRYRVYDIDYVTHVSDQVLYLNGSDTFTNGHTYHKIFSRAYFRTVPNGYTPPIVNDTANGPDNYYGAMRESSKQVFLLTYSGEEMIFDFNAAVGDSIPAYNGKKMVTAIDSVFLGGLYHKRYLTTDHNYYVIEGVGSSEGLIPDLVDGGTAVQFYCFTYPGETFSPDTTIPCTYVYPFSLDLSIPQTVTQSEVLFYPVPAYDLLHIDIPAGSAYKALIINSIGQRVWSGIIKDKTAIPVRSWAPGTYFAHITGCGLELFRSFQVR